MPHQDAPSEQSDTDNQSRQTLARALRLLNSKQLSTGELVHRLRAEQHPQKAIDAALAQCTAWGYLSDQRLAEATVAGALRRGKGPLWIHQNLHRRSLTTSHAASAIQEATSGQLEQILALIAKRYGNAGRWRTDPRLKGKIMRFLAGRGFAPAVIIKAMGHDYDTDD